MRVEPALSPSWTGQVSTSLLGESRGLRNIAFRSRRRGAQRSFPRRPQPCGGRAGEEKTDRPKGCNAPLRRGLASDLPPDPQLRGERDMGTDHWRFATGKPGKKGQARDCSFAQPAGATPPAIQPRPRGTGCRQGVVMRDAIQPRRLVLVGLGGRRPLPFRRASRRTEFAIG